MGRRIITAREQHACRMMFLADLDAAAAGEGVGGGSGESCDPTTENCSETNGGTEGEAAAITTKPDGHQGAGTEPTMGSNAEGFYDLRGPTPGLMDGFGAGGPGASGGGGGAGGAAGYSAGGGGGATGGGGTPINPGSGGVPIMQRPDGSWTSPDPSWAALIDRESSGINQVQHPTTVDVNTGGNEAEGLFQITPKTWAGAGGTQYAPSAIAATPEQQAAVAAEIFRRNPSGSDWGAGLPGREDPAGLASGLGPASSPPSTQNQ